MIVLFPLFFILTRYIIKSHNRLRCHFRRECIEKEIFKPDSFVVWGSSNFCYQEENVLQPFAVYMDDECKDLRFRPPVYAQRYHAVTHILQDNPWKNEIKKVVEFGCAELSYFTFLKTIPGITQVLEVDIDQEILERNAAKSAPIPSDYIGCKRSTPLESVVLAGSVADYDPCLADTDAVIAIELIEHLYEDVLELVPKNIFERIQPRLAIITTPNADFNILFPNLVGFRNDDHKFEWTRKEFYDWTQNIIKMYPKYQVKYYGIGSGPGGTEELGCCSQMAVFYTSPDESKLPVKDEDVKRYSVIRKSTFPVFVDKRTNEEKIVDEVKYRLANFRQDSHFYNYDTDQLEIPLVHFYKLVQEFCVSVEHLREILVKNGWTIMELNNELYVTQKESNYSEDDNSWQEEAGFSDTPEQTNQPDEVCDWDQKYEEKPLNSSQLSVINFTDDSWFDKDNIENNLVGRKRSFEKCHNVGFNFSSTPVKNNKFTIRPHSSYIRKSPKKISKSCSLDSCLENINCEPIEVQAFYLNLLSNGVVSPVIDSHSCEKGIDSGCPLSAPSPDEFEVRSSTSESSLSDDDDNEGAGRLQRAERPRVDNGDLANNNRDGEGNNVEGFNIQIQIPDPNDNVLMQQFPPWLLNLGALVPPPPVDEGLGDDTSSSEDEAEELDLDISTVNLSSESSETRK